MTVGNSLALGLDCNGNARIDLDDIQQGISQDCNGNLVPDECEVIPVELGLGQTSFPVPRFPRVLKAGDLDGDGDLDIVAGCRITGARDSKISVLLNNADGTFATGLESTFQGILYSLVLGDLDGDGALDVVTANDISVSALINGGKGALGSAVISALPTPALAIALGDVTGDGVNELITANRAVLSVSVLSYAGQGLFGNSVDFPVGQGPESVTTGDFNNDGRLDLATANKTTNDYSILLSLGGGAFAPAASYPIQDIRASDVVAADFNGDGFIDLAAATPKSVSVLMNSGNGSFREAVTFAGSGARLGVGDFDSDGDSDIVVPLSPNVLALKVNDGNGEFNISTGFNFVSLPGLPTPGDFDNDGDVDLAVTNVPSEVSAVSVLWNGKARAVSLKTVSVPLTGCSDEARGCHPHSGNLGDLNNDGYPDAVGCNTHPSEFSIAVNQGNGELVVKSRAIPFSGVHAQSVALGDLNADGKLDAVTVDNLDYQLLAHLGNGDFTFKRAVTYPVGAAPLNVALADFDGDNDLDAVTANEGAGTVTVLFNQGDGTFARLGGPGGNDQRVESSPRAVVAQDLDNDGDVDIAVANFGTTLISVLKNNGDGTFAAKVGYRLKGAPNYVSAGDFNKDGHVDLVTANTDIQKVSIFMNNGDGTFATSVDYLVGQSPYMVTVADMNGDGQLDLVTGNELENTVSVLLGKGDGTFGVGLAYPAGTGLRFVRAGDLDLDGDLDLVSFDRMGVSFTALYNESALGDPDYLEKICTLSDFHQLAIEPEGASTLQRFVKFALPASPNAKLKTTVYQNTERYALHPDFLSRVFPDAFPALSADEYDRKVGLRATREYYVGVISSLHDPKPLDSKCESFYGFSLFVRWNEPQESLTAEEVKDIYEKLKSSFRLEPFYYYPTGAAAKVAAGWNNPGFPICFGGLTGRPPFAPYTKGVGFGRVRLMTLSQFETAYQTCPLGFQDVLVLDEAPRDIEGVVGGVITAEEQGELSHVGVRTARRGTPNAYVRDAREKFTPLDGKLVRLEVTNTEYLVREATLAEAEEFWVNNRPNLGKDPDLDGEFSGLPLLAEIAAMGDTPTLANSRVGGKATNFAKLQRILTGPMSQYRAPGFGIPVRYYLEFMRSNKIPSALDAQKEVTYQEYLQELFLNEEFRGNSCFRLEKLTNLQEHAKDQGKVSPELVFALAERILEVFGTTDVNVRFRSSSNVEDGLEFNGAGLYDSYSGCAADDLDADSVGPSICDPSESKERGVARALRRVWASLWNYRAYEEREFYQVPQGKTAMGILVSTAFPDELANGVAFTGNPTNSSDRRYVVVAQVGEISVVAPDAGVVAEKNILEVEGGQVKRILRAGKSTLRPDGEVLSDDHLKELGAFLWYVDQNFPIELGGYLREDVLLDLEYKITAKNTLAVKQIRPFLHTDAGPKVEGLAFELEIPPQTVACGVFRWQRCSDIVCNPRVEYERKTLLEFVPGKITLPTNLDTFSGKLFQRVLFGPNREVATPLSDGLFRVFIFPGIDDEVTYRFEYEQPFSLSGGGRLEVRLESLDYHAIGEEPVEKRRILDQEMLTDDYLPDEQGIVLRAVYENDIEFFELFYSSCTYEKLPCFERSVELSDGSSIRFQERFRDMPIRDWGPASIVKADVVLGGTSLVVNDYWSLVYAGSKHNQHLRHWIVLDPPVTVENVTGPVHVVQYTPADTHVNPPIPANASYLGMSFEVLKEVGVVSAQSTEGVCDKPEPRFRRGDVDADGHTTLTDAIYLLRRLFAAGPSFPCQKAADSNDDGTLNLTDAIVILSFLFLGEAPPSEPFLACGTDPSPADGLSCESFTPCP